MEPQDPDFAAKVRDSFARQRVMDTIGAELTRVDPGLVEIELPHREDLTQQHGYLHAGITTTIADSAGGYACFSLMPPKASVLTVEYKVNLLAPAAGERFRFDSHSPLVAVGWGPAMAAPIVFLGGPPRRGPFGTSSRGGFLVFAMWRIYVAIRI